MQISKRQRDPRVLIHGVTVMLVQLYRAAGWRLVVSVYSHASSSTTNYYKLLLSQTSNEPDVVIFVHSVISS